MLHNGIAGTGYIIKNHIDDDGNWVVGVRVEDDSTWEAIKKGVLKGFSIFGSGEILGDGEIVNPQISKISVVENPSTKEVFSIVKEDKSLNKKEKLSIKQANEVYCFSLNNLNNSYSLPRWANSVNCVIQNILIEEYNISYYTQGCKADLVITSNTALDENSITQLKSYINDASTMEQARKSILLFPDTENTFGISEQNVSIDIKQLNKNAEGSFLKLYELNNTLIISSCSLQPISVGLTSDYNKSTSDNSLEIVDQNTFK